MDLGDKDNSGQEKRTMDPLNYNPSNLSTEWQYDNANLSTQPLRMMPTNNSMEVCKGDLMGSSASSSVSMVDTFSPNIWGLPNSQTLGFCNNNLGGSSSSIPTSTMGIDKALEMGWNHPNSMLRGGGFLQTGAGILPPSLSHFPADSAFIERAARFSCFNGGNFSDLVNPLSQAQNLYSKGGGPIQGPREILLDNRLKPISDIQSQKEVTMTDVGKDFSLAVEHIGGTKGSPLKNDRDKGNFVRSYDEGNQGIGVSNSEAEEAEFSGSGGQEEQMLEGACGEPSVAKGLGIKKRRRNGQIAELDQAKGSSQLSGDAMKDDIETKAKGDQNPTSSTGKATGKHGKDSSQALDTPKEDYIHVRARRGQATNSHSLAERVRREKISERMKYLQELVPGCSKVTGKAVMLDEIINYVQSLQRQVEFLSMKLATVNPRLDFSIEGLLAKDMLQSRGGPSTMGFSPDMSMGHHHQLHPSQHGLIQAGITGTGNPSDVLRRTIDSQLTAMNAGYKELTPQIPNVWDDELNNVIQMSFGGANAPLNSEDLNGGPQAPPGQTKAEP